MLARNRLKYATGNNNILIYFKLIGSAKQNRILLWTGFDLDWFYGHPLTSGLVFVFMSSL